jgi:predicted alpha/beta hydrolase family esterase
MGRRAIIFHGTGARPGWIWYPWLADRLRERGYDVETLLPTVLAAHTFDEDTVLVGHSGGAALLLALLEHLDVTVAQAVLVAGYSTNPNPGPEPVLQDAYDWDVIRSHAGEFVFLNSVTDEYGCDAEQGRAMFDRLGGTLVVRD